MNNREAFDFLKSKTSVREASIEFMTRYNLGEDQYDRIRYQFCEMKSSRDFTGKKMTSVHGKN